MTIQIYSDHYDSLKASKLVAIAYGRDGVGGDSTFYAGRESAILYSGQSYDDILVVYIDWLKVLNDYDDESINDILEELAGFWIVPFDILQQIENTWNIMDPGSDSSVYRCNRACRQLAKDNAIIDLIHGMGVQKIEENVPNNIIAYAIRDCHTNRLLNIRDFSDEMFDGPITSITSPQDNNDLIEALEAEPGKYEVVEVTITINKVIGDLITSENEQ